MNENIKRIFLHIGLPKTGTSSIQSTLYHKKNQIILNNNGYLYPNSLEKNHSFPLFSAFCDKPEEFNANINKKFSLNEIRAYNNRNLFFLNREIANSKANSLILSGEVLHRLGEHNILQMQKYFKTVIGSHVKISIIVYVRNPLYRSVSSIQQAVKNGSDYKKALKYIKSQAHCFFRDSIEKYIDIFGKKNIKLYSFEKAVKHTFGPVGHFLSAIAFQDKDIEKFTFNKINQRISQVAADIISYINLKRPMHNNGKLNEGRYRGDRNCLFKISGNAFDIIKKEKEEIFTNSLSDVYWLKEQFNIDYTKKPLFETKKQDYIYNQKICKELELAYAKASPLFRQLIYQYFLEEVNETKMTNPNKRQFLKTLKKTDCQKNQKSISILKQLKLLKHYFLIKNSPLFDKTYYLCNNEHKSPIKSNPIFHYLKVGTDQGKNPSKDFNTTFYLQQNRDVRNEGINPLVHYLLHGKEECRVIQNNSSMLDFFILSNNKNFLNSVYEYLRWHPLIYLNHKFHKTTILEEGISVKSEEFEKLLYLHNASLKSDQKIAGSLFLIEDNFEQTIKKLYQYNPHIKIIFLQIISTTTDLESLKEFMRKSRNMLFLSIALTQRFNLLDKLHDETMKEIFSFLEIDPWKPV